MSGISRPVVGTISGLALFVLVEGGIVPLKVGAEGTVRSLYFVGIAFLADFSERLAQDVFGKATKTLHGAQQERQAANEMPTRSRETVTKP
jgi:hypothetical protein